MDAAAAPTSPWHRGRRVREGALLALLALLLAVRHAPEVFSAAPLIDEGFYLRAFAAARDGASPYLVDGYYYPPGFAAAGGWLLRRLPEAWVLAALRGINLGALLWLVAASSRFAGLGPRGRAFLAAAVLLFSPGIALGVVTGNISFAVAAAILAAALHWSRAPWAAGALLGASLALKPMAAGAIAVLASFRSGERRPRLRLLAAAGGATLALTLPSRELLGEFLRLGASLPVEAYPLTRTIGVHRLLFNLGWEIERTVAVGLVLLAALLVGRLRPRSELPIVLAALVTATLATPVIWSHTLVLTLPLQMAIAGRCLGPGAREVPALHRIALLCLALALQLTDGIGGLAPGPSLALAAAQLPMLAAPVVLAAWLERHPLPAREAAGPGASAPPA